jgi:membrane protein YqaA with SNARE-associated domain
LLPIPIEAVLAPFMQMRRDIIWWVATLALAGFVTAALMGYGVGALFQDEVGHPIIRSMGWESQYEEAAEFLEGSGFWALLAIGLTPVPTQIVMIGAGALAVPLYFFVPAILLARGLRCYGLGLLVHLYGDRVVAYFTRRNQARRARAAAVPRPAQAHYRPAQPPR